MTKEQILAPFYKQNKGGLEEWIDYSDALDVNQISIAQAEGDRLEFGGGGVVAQSQLKLEGIPVISLNKYVERLAEKEWKNVNRTFEGFAFGREF